MKIAVTYEDGAIFQHFGQSHHFKIYDTGNGKVISSAVVSTDGKGHGLLADVLKSERVDAVICGGIGAGAQTMLAEAGIKFYGGVSGNADQAVNDFLAGRLQYDPDVQCSHHGEHGPDHK